MSYRNMARWCAVGAGGTAFVFGVPVGVMSMGLMYLPVAVGVAMVAGALGYLTIRAIWLTNGERLTKKGHRW